METILRSEEMAEIMLLPIRHHSPACSIQIQKAMESWKPSAVMSTAEAVSVYYQAMITGYYYGDGTLSMESLVQNLVGAVAKENMEGRRSTEGGRSGDDLEKVKEYFNTVIRDKSSKEGGLWKEYYEARKWLR